MILIVDTNRIIAGLMKDSITREILLNTNFEFYIPEYLLLEIEKHKELILRKSGLSEIKIWSTAELIKVINSKKHLIP